MSFGEGDLHGKLREAEERADMYRRQLGGMTAAHSKRKKELEEAKAEIAELKGWAGQLESELGRSCTMTCTYHGEPCSDWTCSRCGKTHVVHNAARLGEFCPRCGARVTGVARSKAPEGGMPAA